MNNAELLELVSAIDGRDKAELKARVDALSSLGLRHVYSEAPGYWRRTDQAVELVENDYLVDLRDLFPDFMRLRFVRDIQGEIAFKTDKAFRMLYPDDSTKGRPFLYIVRDDSTIQLFYRSDGTRTIYVNYEYRPDYKNVQEMPDDWEHVIFYYVMSHLEGNEKTYYKRLFADGLSKMKALARPAEESVAEILPDELEGVIQDGRKDMER